MPSKKELDLTGLLPPVCLLQCKKQLNKMAPGEVLCVCLQDQETVNDLALIVERSKDQIIKQRVEEGIYRIDIQKA